MRTHWMMACLPALVPAPGAPQDPAQTPSVPADACTLTASLGARAARVELDRDLLIELAKCVNTAAGDELADCLSEAWSAHAEGLAHTQAVFGARLELCSLIGEAPYHPQLDPQQFAAPKPNPFFPLEPGTTLVYEKHTEDGLERVEETVLHETRTILGIECAVVRVDETLNGAPTELTFDWYATDGRGNVWYFGERSMEFENGDLVSLEGSWEAGVDGAQPGLVMHAQPEVGLTYRQEFLLGEAEDAATVEALGVSVAVPYGAFDGCLKTRDFSPLEPSSDDEEDDGEDEDKYYAPGVGLILEFDRQSGEALQLVGVERR